MKKKLKIEDKFQKSLELFFFFRVIVIEVIFMTFKYRYRKQILLGIIILIALLGVSIPIFLNYRTKEKNSVKKIALTTKDTVSSKKGKSPESTKPELYKVDIKGEIVNPGIYSLPKDSRVIDVITAAGGLSVNANTTVINLSKKIIDEMVIIVYSNAEVANFKETKELEKQVQTSCQQPTTDSLKNDACIAENDTTLENKISINTATIKELETLPGIGESKATDIINYRTQNGPFKAIEDLKNISGIGEQVYAKIKDYITI